jgi:transcriptional regulator with XRE-family HTH domain
MPAGEEDAVTKTFGKLVEELRRGQGLSVYALAQRTGLSGQAIHDLEQSDRTPSLDTARRLAAALGASLDWIASQLPPVELPQPGAPRPRGRPKKQAGAQPLLSAPIPPPADDRGAVEEAPPARKGKGRKPKGP